MALIVCAGIAEMTAVLLQHRVVRELSTHVQPLELANAQLRSVLADAQRGLRGFSLTGDSQMLDTYHVARSDYSLVSGHLRTLADAQESQAVEDQLRGADAWFALAEQQRQARPRSDEAVRFVSEGKVLFQAFAADNQALDADLAARTESLQKQSSRLGSITLVVLIVLTLGAALTALVTAVVTARRITRPLGEVVGVLARRGQGQLDARADARSGPTEIRAVAAAVNSMADEGDRARLAERDIAALRSQVRELGYRIRTHLTVREAIGEAIQGLAPIMRAQHVLVRMAPGQAGVPQLTSLHDEHVDGPLAPLAGCPVDWLHSGDVWATDDPAPAGDVRPPEAERQAWEQIGRGPVLTVAVSAGDECLGALTLIRDTGPAFTAVDIRLTEVVAADLGRGVHLARLYEREQQLVARLQEVDTAKTDFMSTVSHELRTPLTSISGYVELLLDAEAGELTPPQTRMLDVIGRNTRRLRELIEEMLILSKIESGAFQTTRLPLDLIALVEGAVAAIAPAAAKAEVGLHTELHGPLEVSADADQLDRVLMNLLSNAVKFTPPTGTVTLLVRREDTEVVITVADTGMGIPEGEQKALFTRFFRASNAVRQAVPGTGLGLAIVSTVVDNHGGHIEVQSTEGVGTTFTIHLPMS
ncbi:multi-sensor signal transduction histidine kinase [Actinoplanes friuliensis DSM 7358]|uniref:histidine kinase n=1 Tax=Actinoplanes friuliensis DSM 7358 TaxID=1246995 RepID=U5VY10_9ACTN|nr:multi-sensor signal transduction histidine kinase [Actinoplanes friuliensis DSM 7358]